MANELLFYVQRKVQPGGKDRDLEAAPLRRGTSKSMLDRSVFACELADI